MSDSEEEEDDYLSEAVLAAAESAEQRARAGEASRKLSYAELRRQKERAQAERRKAQSSASKTPAVVLGEKISSDNVGFALLAKMGYKYVASKASQ
jgi:predicted dienelactone hydrolase